MKLDKVVNEVRDSRLSLELACVIAGAIWSKATANTIPAIDTCAEILERKGD